MTGGTIRDRILERLEETPGAPVFYTAAQALDAGSRAQRIFCLLTLILEKTAPLTVSGSTPFVAPLSQASDWIAPLRIRVSGGAKVLPGTLADFDALSTVWQTETGPPKRYAALGANLLAFHPFTATTVDATYAKAPADLLAGTEAEIPAEYHEALIDAGIVFLRLTEGGQEFGKVLPLWSRFLATAQAAGDKVRARSVAQGYDLVPFELARYDRGALARLARLAMKKADGSLTVGFGTAPRAERAG